MRQVEVRLVGYHHRCVMKFDITVNRRIEKQRQAVAFLAARQRQGCGRNGNINMLLANPV